MPIGSILAALALASLSACAYPRAAITTGTIAAVLGGTLALTTERPDCSKPEAPLLCGLGATMQEDTGAVLIIGGFLLVLAGLAGLSNESRRPHPTAPVPSAPGVPGPPAIDAALLHAAVDHRM